ncbi:MAG: hypothetical protein HYZ81_22270 [Nitrospinae bacterium]|nr:hypothetical protein [Nitrospinota bacterium]
MAAFIEQSNWTMALERASTAQTIFLLGATDTGKTTFLAWLANALHDRGRGVAIVDADVGQSSVGPPTTIGFGLVTHPLRAARELAPRGLYFVGSMSPRSHLLPLIVGTKRMVDRGHALGVDHVLVDTTGLIGGDVGRALKQHKISLVSPDLILCLQRAGECESILRAYRHCHRPQVVRLEASSACRRRGVEERRLYRENRLRRYFASARPLTLQVDELNIVDAPIWGGVPLKASEQAHLVGRGLSGVLWAEQNGDELLLITQERLSSQRVAEIEQAEGMRVRTWMASELPGTLLGLLDKGGETLGLGLLQGIDFAHPTMAMLAPRCEGEIAGIKWSRTRVGPAGELNAELSYALHRIQSSRGGQRPPKEVL